MGIDFRFYLNRQGIQGKRGERGEQGFSPLISVKTQTANEYILTVQNEDGSFDTPNLRGNAIANNGGTYIRYNPLTQEMYTGDADYATNEQAGVVLLSTYTQLEAGGSEGLIPTSADVYDLIQAKIASIGQGYVTQTEFDNYTAATALTLNGIAGDISTLDTSKMSFTDLVSSLVAGNNITLTADAENKTITIDAAGGDLSNYVTTNTVQTITQSKTFNGNGELHFTQASNGIYFEDVQAPSRERIRIFGRVHSAGVSFDDLTLKSYMDIQFELSGNGGTTRLSEIKSAMTLANTALQQSDLSIASASSDWLNYDSSTGEFSANVDTTVAQNSDNLITSGAVYDGLETKQNIITDLPAIRSGAELGITSEQLENKVSSIDAASSDTEYPSAKCVYDNLETKTDKSQVHALKAYADNGELLTDAEGLADVKNYAHSTFDSSKFTVVGSPNITDDGIASGFSDSNYLSSTTIIDTTKPWVAKLRLITDTLGTSQVVLQLSQYFYLAFSTTRQLSLRTTNNNQGNWITTSSILLNNTEYDIECGYNGSKIFINYKPSGGNWVYEERTPTNYAGVSNSIVEGLGYGQGVSTFFFKGSIDLKQFSITVEGVPVFSGNKTGIDTYTIDGNTITIPYTISITGSKIARASSRQDIATVATALGSANYYTLDEDNGNFTLPQGELYGLIGDKTLRDSYYNGITYWELFSNRRLEQGGTCVSGVEYTLPRPFADANYTLTIPYSSKTATSFIPSATGDFIAKGMGLL